MANTTTVNQKHADSGDKTRPYRPIFALGVALDLVALSLWLGGTIAIGAIVAPIAFHAAENAPSMAGDVAAQKAFAGSIVGGSLRVLNYAAIVCGLIILSSAPRLRRIGASMRSARMLALSVAAALAITVFQQIRLFPAMDAAQASGAMPQFDELHKAYVALSQGQLVILLLAAACYAWILVGQNHD